MRAFVSALLLSGIVVAQAQALPLVRIARADTETHSIATLETDTADYLRNAAIGNMFEIAASQVAIGRAHDPELQRFAAMMVADHTAMEARLSSALRGAGFSMTLPADLDAAHQLLVQQLQSANDQDFDAAFLQQQIMTHESALRLNLAYAHSGRDGSLRLFANSVVPKIRSHLASAEALLRKSAPRTASMP
ncbi:MAG: DUF4142 domain-containing protein [Alphaproteobacteria bacterium]|nr:DUF4142 domain-containing protein [Alphaproteobacteria bacterium]